MNADNESERINRQNQEREDELRRVPLQQIDKSKWPANVRPIAIDETDGLGASTPTAGFIGTVNLSR